MSKLTKQAWEKLDGITPRPWHVAAVRGSAEYAAHYGVAHGEYDFPTVVKAHSSYDGFGYGSTRADAEFIAASPQLVADLLAVVENVEKLAARLRQHSQTTPDDDDHEIICDVEDTIAHWIEEALEGNG